MNLQFRLFLIVDKGTRNPGGLPWRVLSVARCSAQRTILNPMTRLVTFEATVVRGNFSGLGQTHSLVAGEGGTERWIGLEHTPIIETSD